MGEGVLEAVQIVGEPDVYKVGGQVPDSAAAYDSDHLKIVAMTETTTGCEIKLGDGRVLRLRGCPLKLFFSFPPADDDEGEGAGD